MTTYDKDGAKKAAKLCKHAKAVDLKRSNYALICHRRKPFVLCDGVDYYSTGHWTYDYCINHDEIKKCQHLRPIKKTRKT